jgi:hypothetical protein
MAIPYMRHIVADLAARYPDEWRAAHRHGAGTHDFVRRLAWELHTLDDRFGLCGQRGNVNDLGEDSITYRGEGDQYDPTNGNQPISVIDTIAKAGTDDAEPAWILYPGDRHAAAWVKPQPVGDSAPVPQPPPAPSLPPELTERLNTIQSALTFVINQLQAVRNDTHINQTQLAALSEKCNALDVRVGDVRRAIDNGLEVKLFADLKGWGSAKGPITGTARG